MYAQSNQGEARFVGEEQILNTPVGQNVQVNHGQASNVTSHMDSKRLSTDCWATNGRQQCIDEYQLDISLKNALERKIDVHYNHRFYGQFEILSSSMEPAEEIDRGLHWLVPINAKGESKISMRVRVGDLSEQRLQPR